MLHWLRIEYNTLGRYLDDHPSVLATSVETLQVILRSLIPLSPAATPRPLDTCQQASSPNVSEQIWQYKESTCDDQARSSVLPNPLSIDGVHIHRVDVLSSGTQSQTKRPDVPYRGAHSPTNLSNSHPQHVNARGVVRWTKLHCIPANRASCLF